MQKVPYRIIGYALVMVLTCFSYQACANDQNERTIPYPPGVELQGAASYAGMCNHRGSKYFAHPDVYLMRSNQSLTVLPRFRTYQQTTEVTCGPASALMVLVHYGNNAWTEPQIAVQMQTHRDLDGDNTEQPGVANERGEYGTSTDRMAQFFTKIGWKVKSSLTEGKLANGKTFASHVDFKNWVIQNLKENTPIMVEWIDWIGHWQVIVGYDTMGTEMVSDDVIIFADPYDTSDQWQDGYYIYSSERFYYMWEDKRILPESQQYQQWIIAKP